LEAVKIEELRALNRISCMTNGTQTVIMRGGCISVPDHPTQKPPNYPAWIF
jgi:hypothetical protein